MMFNIAPTRVVLNSQQLLCRLSQRREPREVPTHRPLDSLSRLVQHPPLKRMDKGWMGQAPTHRRIRLNWVLPTAH